MEFNLADMFEAVVDAVPDREALVCGDRRYTYAQLDERANRLAHHLADNGVGEGDHIGIHAANCGEWVEAMLAAYKLRAVPVNVNYRYVEDELRYLFDNADLVAVVVEPEYAERVNAVRVEVPGLAHVLVIGDDYENALVASPPHRDFPARSGDDRYIIYTGGTTGLPKGVVWRQEDAFFSLLGGGNFGGPPVEDAGAQARKAPGAGRFVVLVNPPLMHGGGQWVLLSGLLGGVTVVLLDGHYDAERVLQIAERERVNTMSIIGDAMARPLADALGAAGASYDLSSVIVVGSGGAPLSAAVKDELQARLPHALIYDSFGASETGYQGRMAPGETTPRFTMNEFTAVLGDDLRPVPRGSAVTGQVARRGRIPVEYYKDAGKTAATFVDVDGERWALLGDMATVEEDGTITLLGRGSMCINSGGEKIFPEEVEAALKAHTDVFDAIVVGVPDDRFGERAAAVVQPRPDRAPTLEVLAAHCRTLLAGYKVPRQLHLVAELQRHPSGKPDYRWARSVAVGEAAGN